MAIERVRQAAPPPRKPVIKIGPGKITLAKKPLTLKQRMTQAKRAQDFAAARVNKLNAKAEAAKQSGDTAGAARYQAIADKASERLGTANAKVEKVFGAVQKKAAHMGADLAKEAARSEMLQQGVKDREPGGKLEFDKGNLDWYKKAAAESVAKTQKLQAKGSKFEEDLGAPWEVSRAADKFAKEIVSKQGALHKQDPEGYEEPPKLSAINKAMGMPAGGMDEIDKQIAEQDEAGEGYAAKALAPTAVAAAPAAPAAPAPAPKAAPPVAKAPPAPAGGAPAPVAKAGAPAAPAGASRWGGRASRAAEGGGGGGRGKPSLQRGDQGGWYYETKGGAKVYVEK